MFTTVSFIHPAWLTKLKSRYDLTSVWNKLFWGRLGPRLLQVLSGWNSTSCGQPAGKQSRPCGSWWYEVGHELEKTHHSKGCELH